MESGLKKKWLEGLRSGRYTQAHQKLVDISSFDPETGRPTCLCALGVLNEVSGIGHWGSDGVYKVEALDPHNFEAYRWEDLVCGSEDENVRAFIDPRFDGCVSFPDFDAFDDYPKSVQDLIRECCSHEEEEGVHPMVAKAAGFTTFSGEVDTQPSLKDKGLVRSIIELNDKFLLSFDELADLIEEQL